MDECQNCQNQEARADFAEAERDCMAEKLAARDRQIAEIQAGQARIAEALDRLESKLEHVGDQSDDIIARLEWWRDRAAKLEGQCAMTQGKLEGARDALAVCEAGLLERVEENNALRGRLTAMRKALEEIRGLSCTMGTEFGDSQIHGIAVAALATDAGKPGADVIAAAKKETEAEKDVEPHIRDAIETQELDTGKVSGTLYWARIERREAVERLGS